MSNPPLPSPAADLAARERRRWREALGTMRRPDFPRDTEFIRPIETPDFHGGLFRQRTGVDTWQQLLLLRPPTWAANAVAPGAVVPFYYPDAMAGYDLTTLQPLDEEKSVTFFARHLVRQGFIVVATEAYHLNWIPMPATCSGRDDFSLWSHAAAALRQREPEWTGMGKLVHDTTLALDFLLNTPGVDPARILLMGHSLGGKMAFYTGMLDDRVQAVIGNDFGLGWHQTNWESPWYWGDRRDALIQAGFHHEALLAANVPKHFTLIAGEYDTLESGEMMDQARGPYAAANCADRLTFLHHGTGHRPTAEILYRAYCKLAAAFGLPEPDRNGLGLGKLPKENPRFL